MNAVIVYESLTGNTEKASNLMAKELRAAGVATSVCRIANVDYQALANADLVIVGTWTDGVFVVGQRPRRAQRLRRLLFRIDDRVAILTDASRASASVRLRGWRPLRAYAIVRTILPNLPPAAKRS
jgi:sulfite reductase alpha subunit-like flavoprotein